MSPLSLAGMLLVRRATFLGLRYENSDDERTLQSAKLTASLHRDAMLHGTSNRLFILKISNPSAATAGVLRQASSAGPGRDSLKFSVWSFIVFFVADFRVFAGPAAGDVLAHEAEQTCSPEVLRVDDALCVVDHDEMAMTTPFLEHAVVVQDMLGKSVRTWRGWHGDRRAPL